MYPVSIDYQETTLILLNIIKVLQQFSQILNLNNLIFIMENAEKRLKDHQFSIAVVGEFNRGKSTLINALCGEEILPSDILPCSATLNRISYAEKPSAKINFQDGSEREIEFYKLANFVTKKNTESQAVAATVKEAKVYYPISYFQHNKIEIIDTPGLGDEDNMTAVTLSVLQQCELAIMIISAQFPFSITESNILIDKLLENGVGEVLFIVNEIDRFDKTEDVERVINKISHRIEETINEWAQDQINPELALKKIGKPRVWGLSALQALKAKQTHDMALLGQSQFVNFEHDLKTILSEKRSLIILQVTVNQIIKVVTEIIETISLQKELLDRQQAQLQEMSAIIDSEVSKIRQKKREVIQFIDDTISTAQQQAQTSTYKFQQDLKKAAEIIIDNTTVTPAEIKNDNFLPNLSNQISTSLNEASNKLTQNIESEIIQGQELFVAKILDFSQFVENMPDNIYHKLKQLEIDISLTDEVIQQIETVNQLCNNLTANNNNNNELFLISFNSDSFMIQNNPSGVGTGIGAGIGLVLLGPIGAGIGAGIGANIGNRSRAKKFKEKFQPLVNIAIDDKLREKNINQIVDDYVSQALVEVLRQAKKILETINSVIETIQSNLVEQIAQQETLINHKKQQITQMEPETQSILNYAQNLSEKLVKIRSA
ncbi:dynamin family protein [Okeania sp. SIO2B3]|uniref:dynamin family protein n=1 Tax=Okeania sp. SIO2B3 TaxID=2607784 RepID=UPI0013C14530|nr:dynamin family protein [Okeania sp. SIO2B3]NET45448.1 hypothetical protein [Okeania sp. SIO2B3]